MKKKIAIFASGWASQILSQYLDGLTKNLKGSVIDSFLFLCYPSWATTEQDRHGEFNIFRLPHLEDFNAAIVIANGLEFNHEIDYLFNKCREAKIPSISVGIKTDGLYFVGVDNSIGMKDLCNHLINEHKCKDFVFLAGSKDNGDSNLRLKILKDSLQNNNLPFNEENLYYTNWENAKTLSYIDEWCEKGKKLPDAFVCANDGIAMNVCLSLENHGYSVPKDVLVTGFDNNSDAIVFDPSISSVSQNYELLGTKSGKLILDLFNGKKVQEDTVIPCSFVANESCCPSKIDDTNLLRRKKCHDNYALKGADILLDRKLNYIERMILTGRSFADIRVNLVTALGSEFKYEGDSFHIVLEPSYELSIYNASLPLRTEGYSSAMEVAFSKEKGFISNTELFNSRELIPDHNPDNQEHLYVFIPIHQDEHSFGYFVMCDCLSKVDGHFLPKYQQRLNIAFERYREKLNLDELNRKLTEITRIDTLTHVKNRMAYESRAKELYAEIKTDKKPQFAIAMFDVNNLKKINDKLGHNAGDTYIINACKLICKTFAHSPVYRIGGDEFLAILQKDDYKNRKKLINSMNKQMEDFSKAEISETEKISIASGIAEYSPKTDTNIQDVFKRADTIMYKNKEIMKGSSAR